MGKVYIGTPDGKELSPLGEIKEIDLTSEESGIEYTGFLKGSETFECKVDLSVVGHEGLDPMRYLCSGGDKSMYNAMTLKEDGYLSPKNGWV